MSIPDSITTDDFAALRPEAHALAIYVHSQRLTLLNLRLRSELTTAEAREMNLLEQRQLHTLRKVHATALNEQLQEQGSNEVGEG